MRNVILDPTDERLFPDPDNELACLEVDKVGTSLSVSTNGSRASLSRLADAINGTHKKLLNVNVVTDDLQPALQSLSKQHTHLDMRVGELETNNRELRIQIGTCLSQLKGMVVSGGGGEPGDVSPRSGGSSNLAGTFVMATVQKQVMTLSKEVKELAAVFQKFKTTQVDDLDEVRRQVTTNSGELNRYKNVVFEELDRRLKGLDDRESMLKVDVASLRGNLQDLHAEKASNKDMEKVFADVQNCITEIHYAQEFLEDARASFEKLDDCYRMASTASEGMQETMRLFREESALTRDWCSKGISDLRSSVLALTNSDRSSHQRTERQVTELRQSLSEVSATESRLEAALRAKADGSEVMQLAERLTASDMGEKRRTFLLGGKCFMCNGSGLAGPTVHQPPDADGQRPQTVSERTGNQRDSTKALFGMNSRPATSGASDIPARAPPRLTTPIVRIPPNSIRRLVGGRPAMDATVQPPSRTIRSTLGGRGAVQEPAQETDGITVAVAPQKRSSKVPPSTPTAHGTSMMDDGLSPGYNASNTSDNGGVGGSTRSRGSKSFAIDEESLPTLTQPGGSGCPAASCGAATSLVITGTESVFDALGADA